MEGVIEMRAKVADLVSQILQGKPQLEESRVIWRRARRNFETLGSGDNEAASAAAAAVSCAGDSSDMFRAVLQGIRRASHVPSTLYLLVDFRGRSFSVTLMAAVRGD